MIEIVKWEETFESAESKRKCPKSMTWLRIPATIDSNGLVELLCHGQRGREAYAVFVLLCQISAGNPISLRGKVCRSSGAPILGEALARRLRMTISELMPALELLESEDVGWITTQPCQTVDGIPPQNGSLDKIRRDKKRERIEEKNCAPGFRPDLQEKIFRLYPNHRGQRMITNQHQFASLQRNEAVFDAFTDVDWQIMAKHASGERATWFPQLKNFLEDPNSGLDWAHKEEKKAKTANKSNRSKSMIG